VFFYGLLPRTLSGPQPGSWAGSSKAFSGAMIFVVSENRRYRKIRMEASSNVLRADMDVVEGLDVDASATRAEASIQGRTWDQWCPKGFVFARETRE
jgi:hypothetical protein